MDQLPGCLHQFFFLFSCEVLQVYQQDGELYPKLVGAIHIFFSIEYKTKVAQNPIHPDGLIPYFMTVNCCVGNFKSSSIDGRWPLHEIKVMSIKSSQRDKENISLDIKRHSLSSMSHRADHILNSTLPSEKRLYFTMISGFA